MGKKQIRADTFDIKKLSEYMLPGYQSSHLANQKGVFGFLPVAVIVTDENGLPVSYNQAATDLFGKIPPKVCPEDWPEKFGLHQADDVTQYPGEKFPLLHALRGENVQPEEIFLLNDTTPEGKWLTISTVPLISHKGKVEGALVFFSDITAFKHDEIIRNRQAHFAEASYALSQQIAKIGNDPMQILNAVVESICETVGDGGIASLLNSTKDKLKIIASHHVNLQAQAILQTASLSTEYRLEGMVEETIRSGEPLMLSTVDENRLRQNAKPEQQRYIDVVGVQSIMVVPIKGREGILGTLTLLRDRGGSAYTADDQTYIMDVAYRTGLAIDNRSLVNSLLVESSVRRIAERALELSEVRFRSIFTSTALGIKLLDLDGIILETNPAFQNILGYTEEELRGRPIIEFWHPEDARLMSQLLDQLKSNRVQSFQLEHRLVSKEGSTIWFNVTFSGIKNSNQEDTLAFIVAIAENITQRKRMEAEMAEMKSRLHGHVEMERLQLAQELHDGPLQDLYSAIYKIENWGEQENKDNQAKVEILKLDLLKVIQVLRNTAKNLRPPALTNFGLEKAIRSHAEEFSEAYPELTLQLNLTPDRQALPEDIRLVLFRIYQHSLANVLRHAQATEIYVKFAFDAEEAQLEVRDNGIGFNVPTNWVELVRQGHFGLAGAVERISLLGGTFLIDSKPGQGTNARVVIPIRESSDFQGKGDY